MALKEKIHKMLGEKNSSHSARTFLSNRRILIHNGSSLEIETLGSSHFFICFTKQYELSIVI